MCIHETTTRSTEKRMLLDSSWNPGGYFCKETVLAGFQDPKESQCGRSGQVRALVTVISPRRRAAFQL